MNPQNINLELNSSLDNVSNQPSVEKWAFRKFIYVLKKFIKIVNDKKVYLISMTLIALFFIDRGASNFVVVVFSIMGTYFVYIALYLRSILKMDFNFDLRDFK